MDGKNETAGHLFAVITILIWGTTFISTKVLLKAITPIEILFLRFTIGFIVLLLVYPHRLKISVDLLIQPVNLFNILFLGLGASALCFVTWNSAVRILGAVKTSVYIYMVPVITVTTSVIILREEITRIAVFGIVLTLAGLFISENKIFIKKKGELLNE